MPQVLIEVNRYVSRFQLTRQMTYFLPRPRDIRILLPLRPVVTHPPSHLKEYDVFRSEDWVSLLTAPSRRESFLNLELRLMPLVRSG